MLRSIKSFQINSLPEHPQCILIPHTNVRALISLSLKCRSGQRVTPKHHQHWRSYAFKLHLEDELSELYWALWRHSAQQLCPRKEWNYQSKHWGAKSHSLKQPEQPTYLPALLEWHGWQKKQLKIIQPGHKWGTTVPQTIIFSDPDIQHKQCLPNSNCSLIWGFWNAVQSQQSPVQWWGSITFQHLWIKGWKDLRRWERSFWYKQTDLLSQHCVWDSGDHYQI